MKKPPPEGDGCYCAVCIRRLPECGLSRSVWHLATACCVATSDTRWPTTIRIRPERIERYASVTGFSTSAPIRSAAVLISMRVGVYRRLVLISPRRGYPISAAGGDFHPFTLKASCRSVRTLIGSRILLRHCLETVWHSLHPSPCAYLQVS